MDEPSNRDQSAASVEGALSWIVEWCDSHDHHFGLVTIGNAPAVGHRFAAEVTRGGVGAVAPTVSKAAVDPASAIRALAASLEAS